MSELISRLTPLAGAHCALKDKMPQNLSKQMNTIGEITHRLTEEVKELHNHLDERFDLESPDNVAEQIRELSLNWKRYEKVLSASIDQIRRAGVRIDDPMLNDILYKSLIRASVKLKRIIAFLEVIEPRHLMPYEGPFSMPELE